MDAGPPPSDNFFLSGLTVSPGTLEPAFDRDTRDYQVGPVVFPDGEVAITVTAEDPAASIRVNATDVTSGDTVSIPVGIGTTTANVVVRAPDESRRRTYTVVFDGTSARLSELVTLAGTLRPSFDPDIPSYRVRVPRLTSQAELVATSADPMATITIDGEVVESGVTSQRIPLAPASRTTVEVTCTARDGETVDEYEVLYDGAQFAEVALAKADPVVAGDRFGSAMAVFDGRVAVGISDEDSDGSDRLDDSVANSGAVVLLSETAEDVFEEEAYLKAASPAPGDRFGLAVDIDGDTLVVGAPGRAAPGPIPRAGAVFVFTLVEDAWVEQSVLFASNPGENDMFGTSVGIDGNRVIVGAPGEASDGSGPDVDDAVGAGAAYVFEREGTTWSEVAYLKADNARAGALFGSSVDVYLERVAVGAPGEATEQVDEPEEPVEFTAPNSGAVYVFEPVDGGYAQVSFIKGSPIDDGDQLGTDVSMFEQTIVAGAPGDDASGIGSRDDAAVDSGAAYVFTADLDGVWTEQAFLKANAVSLGFTLAGDRFGTRVDLVENTVLIGAPGEDGDGTNEENDGLPDSGAAYSFRRLGGVGWDRIAYLKASNAGPMDRFGEEVATDGGLFAVGAPAEDSVADDPDSDGATDAGAIYLFK